MYIEAEVLKCQETATSILAPIPTFFAREGEASPIIPDNHGNWNPQQPRTNADLEIALPIAFNHLSEIARRELSAFVLPGLGCIIPGVRRLRVLSGREVCQIFAANER
jgi:hypothetical protein